MATLASLLVVMGMDTSAMTAGAAKAEGSLAGLGVSAKTMGSVVPLAAAAAAVGVVKFAADAVGAASDFEESANKVRVVFGSSSQEIMDWSETMSSSFGISQQAALESAGTFGNLFDAMGLAQDAGTEMSMTLVELAADLASFNNASPEDVLAAMQSGLTGQIRPLRQYGIEISEAALKQEALAQGITKSTTEMTMAEKVQLRYALILKQTGNAQGDFARTSEGLANQQRILAAQWADLQVAIGTLLLPMVKDFVSSLNDLATVLLFVAGATENFDQKTKDAATSLAQTELKVADFFLDLTGGIPIIGDFVDMWRQVDEAQKAAAEAGGLTSEQLLALQGVIEAGDPSYTNFRDNIFGMIEDFRGVSEVAPEVRKHLQHLTDDIPKVAKAFRDTRDALIEEIPAIRGVATTYAETFKLGPAKLREIAETWARIARTIASDLREIAHAELTPRMREAIAALPPEMRHAWVEGNDKQRSAIVKSIQTTFRVEDQMPKLAREALTGGTVVGTSMDQGIVRGIESGIPAITSAARNAVEAAIRAAKVAAAAESPSKKMAELGHDMMEGLVRGLLKDENKLLAAAEKVMSDLQDKMSKLMDKASSFGQTIQGGFSSLLSFPTELPEGTDIASFFQSQLGTAQQFASILKALQAQGAGKGLLTEIAGQGPAGIPMAQQLLQLGPEGVAAVNKAYNDIARIAEKTADSLTNRYFGERISDLRGDIRDQKAVLVDIRQNVRYLEKINDNLANPDNRKIEVNIGGSVVTEREFIDSIREGLIAAGRSGQGHH